VVSAGFLMRVCADDELDELGAGGSNRRVRRDLRGRGAPVAAQQSPSPSVDKNAIVLVPGVLTGPGTMRDRKVRPVRFPIAASRNKRCRSQR
jgi:hypothetical protein